MATTRYVYLNKWAFIFLAGALIWLGLPAGLYMAISGSSMWGWGLIGLSTVVAVLVLDGRAARAAEKRRIEKRRAGFIIMIWTMSTVMILFIIYLSADVLRLNTLWIVLYGLIFLILMSMAATSLFKRERAPDA